MRSDVCIQVFILLNEKAEGPRKLWHRVSVPHLHTYVLTAKTEKLVILISILGQAKGEKKHIFLNQLFYDGNKMKIN